MRTREKERRRGENRRWLPKRLSIFLDNEECDFIV